MSLKPGVYLGPYEILSTLGEGGMGEVYRARDGRLGRDVAVKVLPARLAQDAEALERFEREARTLAALSHPNILTLYDFANQEGIVYAVMELLEGRTLRDVLNEGPLPGARVLEVALAVSDGLAAAHARGIIHRDLKPENIFITGDGRVKILDFGLVRWEQSHPQSMITRLPTAPLRTRTGRVMGTVHYMSPEQVRGVAVDHRTDIFSLGVVLHEMIFGSRPFARETVADTMVAILREPPAEPPAGVDVSRDMLNVIRLCLEKDPQARLASALELNTALKQIATGSAPALPRVPATARRKRKKKIDSIAVLPFDGSFQGAEWEYLADGITESLINILSQIPELRVMARSTVFLYKGKPADPRVVGRDLNVRAILTGRVQKRSEKLDVEVELVDSEDGSRVWGSQLSQEVCDLQGVHRDVARAIFDALKIRLVREEKQKLQKRYTESEEAYRIYLRGRYHLNKRTDEGMRLGMKLFREAIELDPAFALAYAGLADCYSMLGGFYFMPPSEAYPMAREMALKALRMDPELAEGYTSLGTVRERYEWDWKGAGRDFRKAIKLNPGYAQAYHWYAIFLVMMGRFREGTAQMAKALRLDPLSLVMHWTQGYLSYYMRQYDAAVLAFRRTLEMDPQFHRARYDMALAHLMNGQKQMALQTFDEWLPNRPDSPGTTALLGYYYAVSGNPEKAREMIRLAEALPPDKYISRFSLGMIHLALGEEDMALNRMEEAFRHREDPIVSMKVNPRLDPLRANPRFQELLRRIGF